MRKGAGACEGDNELCLQSRKESRVTVLLIRLTISEESCLNIILSVFFFKFFSPHMYLLLLFFEAFLYSHRPPFPSLPLKI